MLDNKLNTAARLKEARIKLRVGSGEFAQKAGIDPRNYSSIETGKRTVGERILRDICSAFPIDINWLLTGDGEMLKSTTGNLVQYATLSTKREKGNIRYWLDIEATGSGVVSFEDSDSNRFIDIRIPEFKDCTDAINLYGDSMAPRYKSGQIVILKKWQESFIEYGNPYLIITRNGHRMVKVLRSIKDDLTSVLCVSFNPDFDPFPIEKEDILELYIVKGAIEKSVL